MSVNKIMCGNRERGCGLVIAECFGSIETPPDREREEVVMSVYLSDCVSFDICAIQKI